MRIMRTRRGEGGLCLVTWPRHGLRSKSGRMVLLEGGVLVRSGLPWRG